MKTKIDANSYLIIDGQIATTIIQASLKQLLFNLLGLSLVLFFIFFIYHQTASSFFYFMNYVFIVLIVSNFLYGLGFKAISTLNINNCTLIQTKKFFGFSFKTSTFNWTEPYRLKYDIEYDSYDKITSIWLVISSNRKKKQTIHFHNLKSFIAFQNIFNEHFPEHQVMEWHD
jgi:hypothetical protein